MNTQATDTFGLPATAAEPLVRVPLRGIGLQTAAAESVSIERQTPALSRAPGQTGKRLDKRNLVMIITQLSIMTRSGVDVADAIRSIAERSTNAVVREPLTALYGALEEGRKLSDALDAQGNRFGGIIVASVAAGEASGRLPDVLERLSELLRDDIRTRSAIRSAVSYPLVLTLVTTGVLGAMLFFVLPQFRSIYETSQAPTPVVTQMLLDLSSLLRGYWWAFLGMAAAAAVGFLRMAKSPTGQLWLDRMCFRTPLLRDVVRLLSLGRVFRLQGVLLENGVPLLEVLKLTRNVSRNSLLRNLNEKMQQAVLVGRNMSSALVGQECVPDGAFEMVSTAETNGQLSSVLQTVGEFFESEGEQQLKEVVKVAEPAIIVALGVVVGAIVVAVMLPMLDLSTAGSM